LIKLKFWCGKNGGCFPDAYLEHAKKEDEHTENQTLETPQTFRFMETRSKSDKFEAAEKMIGEMTAKVGK